MAMCVYMLVCACVYVTTLLYSYALMHAQLHITAHTYTPHMRMHTYTLFSNLIMLHIAATASWLAIYSYVPRVYLAW